MTSKKNVLAEKANRATGAGLIVALTAATLPVHAQVQEERGAEAQGLQLVTGSRIARNGTTTATPVTVISRQDIELSGQENVADLLRNTVFNSFGSFRERSDTSFGQIALVDLRGLGSDRTAVLVNGLRQPGSPFTGGTSANLNSIPINAIERIEILTDSASAIYGSDAIGGAINIVLRTDYEGAEVSLFTAQPTRDGGDEFAGNIVLGGSGDRGNYVFTAEWFDRDPIFDRDRGYSSARFAPGDNLGVDTAGVSAFGNTAYFLSGPNAGSYRAIGDCDPGVFAGIFDYPPFPGDTACGFPYADISAQTGGIKRFGSFLNAKYELNNDHSVYFSNTFSRVDSFGRYAPVAGLFFIGAENPANTFDEDIFLLHRFVAHGPRDDDFRSYEIDNVFGIEGRLGAVDYDVYGRYFISESDAIGRNYVVQSIIDELIADGVYDFNNPTNPSNAGAVTASQATLSRKLSNKTWQTGATFSGDAFDLPAGVVGWAAGAEFEDVRYTDIYDAGREAENVLGSEGSSVQGDRYRWAVFAELLLPLDRSLDLSLAARFDDFSDFGNQRSHRAALRYQPFSSLLLRGSWNQGFGAPSLEELNFPRSGRFEGRLCSVAPCPPPVLIVSGGNPELQAEQSESFSFGVLWEPIDHFTIGGDLYQIEVEDAIQQIGVSGLLGLEQDGRSLPPGTAVIRGPDGLIQQLDVGQANVATITVDGWDLRSAYSLNTNDLGSFNFHAQYSRIKTYDFTSRPGGTSTNLAGSDGSPSHRANWGASWNWSDFTFIYSGRWIGEQFIFRTTLGLDYGRVRPSFVSHDLLAVWSAPWDGELQVGVRNIGNKLPSLDPEDGFDPDTDLLLYPVEGRTPFIRYTQHF